MIADVFANAALYATVHPLLEPAFAYIEQFERAGADGIFELDGDNAYAKVQSYATKPESQRNWESHRRYIDVQYIVSGRELTRYAHTSSLRGAMPYNPVSDVVNYSGCRHEAGALVLGAGDFVVFFPQDGHRPGITHGEAAEVRKVVVKIQAQGR